MFSFYAFDVFFRLFERFENRFFFVIVVVCCFHFYIFYFLIVDVFVYMIVVVKKNIFVNVIDFYVNVVFDENVFFDHLNFCYFFFSYETCFVLCVMFIFACDAFV